MGGVNMNDMQQIDVLQGYLNLLGVLGYWKSHILDALERAKHTHSFDDIVRLSMSGHLAVFAYPDAFMIMEQINYPQFKVLHCFLAGGNHDTIVGTELQMEEVARNAGCKYMSFSGRRGWDKDAKLRGWEFVSTTMYKPIEGGNRGSIKAN